MSSNRIYFTHRVLPAFFLLLFLCPCPPWHLQVYPLSFIWHPQRPQEWRHASVTLGSASIPTESWLLQVCSLLSVVSPLWVLRFSVKWECLLVTLHSQKCISVFMKACNLSKWSERDLGVASMLLSEPLLFSCSTCCFTFLLSHFRVNFLYLALLPL